MERLIQTVLPEIIHLLELFGIIVITVGSIKCFIQHLMAYITHKQYAIRLELGYSLALGLEYKMGAEILKTVLVRDISEIWILGAIILLRAILSLLIHFEMKGESHVRNFKEDQHQRWEHVRGRVEQVEFEEAE